MRTTDGRLPGPEIWIRGPVPAPEPPPGPYAAPPGPRRFSWIGTHGGAGASTLPTVYGGHDSGRDWPGPDDPPSVLLVARTHASGLESVLRTLEVFRLEGPTWTIRASFRGDAAVRAEPFDAIEVELGLLWER